MREAGDALQGWLESLAANQGAIAGTVHLERGGNLVLAASLNIPPQVVAAVRTVPHGKGMAGLALSRRRPVQTCNLKEDTSGDVRPGAKAVDARTAVALPVMDAHGEVRAVVGLAFEAEGAIAPERERALMTAAAQLPWERAEAEGLLAEWLEAGSQEGTSP